MDTGVYSAAIPATTAVANKSTQTPMTLQEVPLRVLAWQGDPPPHTPPHHTRHGFPQAI